MYVGDHNEELQAKYVGVIEHVRQAEAPEHVRLGQHAQRPGSAQAAGSRAYVRVVVACLALVFVSVRTIKRHHHHAVHLLLGASRRHPTEAAQEPRIGGAGAHELPALVRVLRRDGYVMMRSDMGVQAGRS